MKDIRFRIFKDGDLVGSIHGNNYVIKKDESFLDRGDLINIYYETKLGNKLVAIMDFKNIEKAEECETDVTFNLEI